MKQGDEPLENGRYGIFTLKNDKPAILIINHWKYIIT